MPVTTRRPLFLAILAAIGAFYVAHGVGQAIGFELWTSGRLVFSGPPRFEPTVAVGTAVGGFVAWRLAGWRGLLGLVAFAALRLLGWLFFFAAGARCLAGGSQQCAYWASFFEFEIAQLWLVVGVVVAVLAALVARPRIPLRPALEAAGVLGLAGPVRAAIVLLPIEFGSFPQGIPPTLLQALMLADFAFFLAAGVVAGLLLRRGASEPARMGRVLAVAVVLLASPELTAQLRFPAAGVEAVVRIGGIVVALLIVAITALRPPRLRPLVPYRADPGLADR